MSEKLLKILKVFLSEFLEFSSSFSGLKTLICMQCYAQKYKAQLEGVGCLFGQTRDQTWVFPRLPWLPRFPEEGTLYYNLIWPYEFSTNLLKA